MEKGSSPWSVQNGGTRRDSLTAHGVLIGQGSAPVNFVVLNEGQILVGQDGVDPQGKTVSGDATIDASGVVKLFPSAQRGSVLYRGASGWAVATPGTAGQVWTSNGAGADPTYQDATGGGGGVSDTDRRNGLLDRIYASKALASPQRRINSYSLGFKSSGGIDAGTSSGYTIDTTNGVLKPSVGSSTMISAGTGTAIGNMTGSAGLSTIFDGVTNAAFIAGGGTVSASSGYAGKNYSSSPARIDRVVVFGSNDNGFRNSAGTIQLDLYGKNGSAPASETDGTLLGTLSFSETQNESTGRTVTSTDLATAYDYVWVRGSSAGATTIGFTELQFYAAGTTNNLTAVNVAQTADNTVTKGRVLVEYNEVDSIALNTDLIVEVSCDGGTNWTATTLVSAGTAQGGHTIAETEDASCTSGTSFLARVKTLNNKVVEIHGLSLTVR